MFFTLSTKIPLTLLNIPTLTISQFSWTKKRNNGETRNSGVKTKTQQFGVKRIVNPDHSEYYSIRHSASP